MSTRYYAYNEDAFRPSHYSNNTRVKNPTDQAVVSKRGAAPEGYYQAGTQTVSNKAGSQTYNIFKPLQINQDDGDDGGDGGDDGSNGGGDDGGSGDSGGGGGGGAETVDPYQGIEFPDYSDQFSNIGKSITDLSTSFTSEIGRLTNQMTKDREAAEERMAEMQQSFQQSLAARKSKPRVSGIRFADRGTGGRSSSQLLRRGVRGTFGRTGDRLMKISSLNI